MVSPLRIEKDEAGGISDLTEETTRRINPRKDKRHEGESLRILWQFTRPSTDQDYSILTIPSILIAFPGAAVSIRTV